MVRVYILNKFTFLEKPFTFLETPFTFIDGKRQLLEKISRDCASSSKNSRIESTMVRTSFLKLRYTFKSMTYNTTKSIEFV